MNYYYLFAAFGIGFVCGVGAVALLLRKINIG